MTTVTASSKVSVALLCTLLAGIASAVWMAAELKSELARQGAVFEKGLAHVGGDVSEIKGQIVRFGDSFDRLLAENASLRERVARLEAQAGLKR